MLPRDVLSVVLTGALAWLCGCDAPTIDTVYDGPEKPAALGAPIPMEDGSLIVAGTTLLSNGIDPTGVIVGRISSGGDSSWHVLEGDDWTADDYRVSVAPTGDVGFALRHGYDTVVSTTVGVLDAAGQVLWTQEIANIGVTAIGIGNSESVILGGQFSVTATVNGEDLEPEDHLEGIAVRVGSGGDTSLVFRGHTSHVVVDAIRLRADGSGAMATNDHLNRNRGAGPVAAFDAAGGALWEKKVGAAVIDIAFHGEDAYLLTASIDADTVRHARADGELLEKLEIDPPLLVPPTNLIMQVFPRVDVGPNEEILVSGSVRADGRESARVARLGGSGWARGMKTRSGSAEESLNASWTADGGVAATLTIEDGAVGDRNIGGVDVPHRAYRDDAVVQVIVPE